MTENINKFNQIAQRICEINLWFISHFNQIDNELGRQFSLHLSGLTPSF